MLAFKNFCANALISCLALGILEYSSVIAAPPDSNGLGSAGNGQTTLRWDFDSEKDLQALTHWPSNQATVRDGRLTLRGKQEWLSITFREQVKPPLTLRFKGVINNGLFVVFPAVTRKGTEFPALTAADADRERQLICRLSEDRNTIAKLGLVGIGGRSDQDLARVSNKLADAKEHVVELTLTASRMTLRIDDSTVEAAADLPPGPAVESGQIRVVKYVPQSGSISLDWLEIRSIREPSAPAPAAVATDGTRTVPQPAVGNAADDSPRQRLLAAIDLKQQEQDKKLRDQIKDLEMQVKRAAYSLGVDKKRNPKSPTVETKERALNKLNEELAAATETLNELPSFYENEKNKIRMKYPLKGEEFAEFEGRVLPSSEITKIKAGRAKAAEERAKALQESLNAAQAYVDGRLKAGVLRSAKYQRLESGVIEYLVREEKDAVLRNVADEYVIREKGDLVSLAVALVYFQVEYVSQGGVVNNREAYVPIIRLNSGAYTHYDDAARAYILDRNGSMIRVPQGGYMRAGFSLPHGSATPP